jgi:hypothetical protein
MKTNEKKTKEMKTNVDFLKMMVKGIIAVVMLMSGLNVASGAMYDGIRKNYAGDCTTCSSHTILDETRETNIELFLLKASQLKDSRILNEETPVWVVVDYSDSGLDEMLLKASQLKDIAKFEDSFSETNECTFNDQALEDFLVRASGINNQVHVVADASASNDISLEEFLVKASGLKGLSRAISQDITDGQVSMIN